MYGIKGIGIPVLILMMSIAVFCAQDPSVLLEKAIYTEETLGKLNDAIAIYKQIMNTAEISRNTAAMAMYRLGMCYRKLGSEAEAFSTFSALARLYPEQKDLLAKSLFLNMKPAPWADGEIMRLNQKRIGAGSMGGAFGNYSVESGLEGGRPVWYHRYLYGSGQSPSHYSLTAAQAETLLPIYSRIHSYQTYLESRFSANKIEVINLRDSTQPARQITSTGTVYDVWQLISIMRRLPLQLGFEATVPVFESSGGFFASVRLQVAGKETITVPAGSFDCYKVLMIVDDNLPSEQTFWITADNHAYVAKARINRIDEFELCSVETVGKNQPADFNVSETGITLSATRQWYLSSVSKMSLRSLSGIAVNAGGSFHLSAPDLDSDLSVMALEINPDRPDPTKRADVVSQMIGGVEYRYQVRPGSRESVTLAGLTGERYIADTIDIQSAQDVVQYTYRLSSAAKAYSFTFETGKNNFDKMRSTFESIMSTVKVQ